MKKLIALIVVVLLLWPSVAFASTIRDRTQFLYQQVQELEAASVYSNVMSHLSRSI